ncbi:DUF4244 domain-containing protein [Brevibacterium litoralis]|uniref:DUF4244 domain-containing protein n=1 Tax=Brevibacterium litoralis TaxID=3138935 RepID=UPI0032EE9DE1
MVTTQHTAQDVTTDQDNPEKSTALAPVGTKGPGRFALARKWRKDTGASTAEYAIVVLAACGFGALLITLLKSNPVQDLVFGVIGKALGLGG